jgi:DNA-binding MarR family transcriptional regulator
LDSRLVAALERLALALDVLLRRAAREHDLSPLQVRLLVRLRNEGGNRRRLRDLSRSCGVETAAVRNAIVDLEAKGLVESPSGEHDARTVRLILTRAGRSLALAVSDWAGPVTRAVAATPERPKEGLLPVLVDWVEALHRARVLTVARVCPTCRYFAPDIHPDSGAPHHCQLFEKALARYGLRVDCPEHQPL